MSDQWIETTSGTRISSTAKLQGKQWIKIKGNVVVAPHAELRADVAMLNEEPLIISIGKYCFIGSGSVVAPPVLKEALEGRLHGPVKIGSYVVVGAGCTVRLAAIGNRVIVESNSILHPLSIIYDCCIVRSGCQVPPKMVIPPFGEVLGVPGVDFSIKPLPSGYKQAIELEAKQLQILQ